MILATAGVERPRATFRSARAARNRGARREYRGSMSRSRAWLLVAALAACSQPPPAGANAPAPPAVPAAAMVIPANPSPHAKTEVATFGGGCFWCVEAVLERLDGVLDVTSGYAGGTAEHPTYEEVCSGTTGHAEVVRVTFDPDRISYAALLEWFFKAHDPTTLNRQGHDAGTQYRSAIFYHDERQHRDALAAIARLQPALRDPIVTEVTPAAKFWPAEDYHQDYFRKNPANAYCSATIPPKLKKLGLDGKR